MTSLPSQYAAREVPLGSYLPSSIRSVSLAGEDDLLLLFGSVAVTGRGGQAILEDELTIAHWSEKRGVEPALTVRMTPPDGEGAVSVDRERWWYGCAGTMHAGNDPHGVAFFSGPGRDKAAATLIATPIKPDLFLPIEGVAPRGLYLTLTDLPSVNVALLEPVGVRHVWKLPGLVPFRGFPRYAWSAHELADGRIALISLEGEPAYSKAVLRLLAGRGGAEGEIEEIVLQAGGALLEVATALDTGGRLAVVITSGSRTSEKIEATVIDLSRPVRRRWSAVGERINAIGTPRVVSTAENFVVGWTEQGQREPPQIMARELDAEGRAGLAALAVGTVRKSQSLNPLAGLQALQGEPVFFWNDGYSLQRRRLPSSVSGLALLEQAREFACSVTP